MLLLARKQFHLDLIQVYLKGLQSIFSKKKCFSIALRHTLVVLEMH